MKKIQNISIWYNGEMVLGTIFNLNSINDNLSMNATFYYQIFSDNNIQLTEGNLIMEGKDYQDWNTNEYAYNWAAKKLNLQILPE